MILGGRYELVGNLSSGGMGHLKLARAITSGRLVVVKTAHAREDDERLRDEARVGMRLVHPHIVETLDLIDVQGRPGLVTAYVSGASLFDLRKIGPASPLVVCRIGRQIAEALDAIHNATDEHGQSLHMLHRDVTPSNIMLGHDGVARLIDLGIARSVETRASRTETGHVRGTLRYLAPELFAGATHSRRSELWSLGVVLWEVLRGRDALKGPMAAMVGKIISGGVMTLDPEEQVEPRLHKAIGQLLRIKDVERPGRARDVAAMFSMLEKELAGDIDVERLAKTCVRSAVGPPMDGTDERSTIERAVAVFCEQSWLAPPSSSGDVVPPARPPTDSSLVIDLEVEVDDFGDVTAPSLPHRSNSRPPSASDKILSYSSMLRDLERR